mmetsp:Transcript_15674/g.51731  ORF Transcript_15674/g.51731 Transcript_15674/m.51731 type:complete len:215 (-) Transcript_15674:1447-2091(-)
MVVAVTRGAQSRASSLVRGASGARAPGGAGDDGRRRVARAKSAIVVVRGDRSKVCVLDTRARSCACVSTRERNRHNHTHRRDRQKRAGKHTDDSGFSAVRRRTGLRGYLDARRGAPRPCATENQPGHSLLHQHISQAAAHRWTSSKRGSCGRRSTASQAVAGTALAASCTRVGSAAAWSRRTTRPSSQPGCSRSMSTTAALPQNAWPTTSPCSP